MLLEWQAPIFIYKKDDGFGWMNAWTPPPGMGT